jgi:hypothetical protein
MSDVVFILGAGASRQSGAPLMGDFLDTASDLLWSNQTGDKEQQFRRVFSAIGALQRVHSKAQLDLNNIESIFTALELGKIIRSVPGVPAEDIDEVIAALKDLIVATLESTIRFPVEGNYILAPKPYPIFAELIKHLAHKAEPVRSSSVITFNYDVAVDVALYWKGLGPSYALDGSASSSNAVDLLKLHGSLNWAEEIDTKAIFPLHPEQYFRAYQLRSFESVSNVRLPLGQQLKQYFANRSEPTRNVRAEAVIIPPSWNKADYHRALTNIWSRAAQHLSKAQYIFICGYSLPETDSFFRHLYALGSVGETPLRKIIVFNPDTSGETDQRFQRLLGPAALARYEYRPETFDQAIEHIWRIFPERQ